MAGKSDFLENAILNHVFGAETYTPPTSIEVALYTVAPSDSGGGTEVTGGGYARVSLTNNTTNWPTTSSGSKSNAVEVLFPQATGSWGTIVAGALLDQLGNILYHGNLAESKTISANDTYRFEVGQIVITDD